MKKITFYFSVFAIILVALYSCMSYKRVGISNNDPFVNQNVRDNFEYYNVYVHDGEEVYRVQNPSISGSAITGKPVKVESPEELKAVKESKGVKSKNPHKYDLNIYTKKPLRSPVDTAALTPLELQANDIDKVEMYGDDGTNAGLIVLFIVLGVLALAAIIWWIIAVSVHGSNDSADASGNSSASNSNSNSGGGSGGSGGSCYIATMVYGSYDAPEVMVLRSFRDNFLRKFYLGRKFIAVYYKYSPLFVEKFRHSKSVHKPIRFVLNGLVKFLSGKF